jgi:hypothetical protein
MGVAPRNSRTQAYTAIKILDKLSSSDAYVPENIFILSSMRRVQDLPSVAIDAVPPFSPFFQLHHQNSWIVNVFSGLSCTTDIIDSFPSCKIAFTRLSSSSPGLIGEGGHTLLLGGGRAGAAARRRGLDPRQRTKRVFFLPLAI